MPACCGADSSGIDDVVSSVGTATGGVAFGLAAIPSVGEADGSVSPGLNDDAEPAAEGLGLGIGMAYEGPKGAILSGAAAACCVGWPSARTYQHLR